MRAMSVEGFEVVMRPGATPAVQILTVRGAITSSTSPAFQEAVVSVTAPSLIFDLTDVPSIDSMAVGALVRAFVSCNKAGRKLALAGPNHRVRNVLQLTGIDPLFDIYATVAQAEQALR
jgi:anti-sigma B factor antagonist